MGPVPSGPIDPAPPRRPTRVRHFLLTLGLLASGADLAAIPDPAELERRSAIVGRIAIEVDRIFNEADPEEDRTLYRLANRLHRHTRDDTIRAQLLLKTGGPYSVQRAEETARILRGRVYLYDAAVELTTYDAETNTVDLLVRVRDVWSLNPGIGVGRNGGENQSVVRLVDQNFLGRGQYFAAAYSSSVDRSGVSLKFRDQNLFQSWWDLRRAAVRCYLRDSVSGRDRHELRRAATGAPDRHDYGARAQQPDPGSRTPARAGARGGHGLEATRQPALCCRRRAGRSRCPGPGHAVPGQAGGGPEDQSESATGCRVY